MAEDSTLFEDRKRLEFKILNTIREVPDFPEKGVNFKDINSLFEKPELCSEIIEFNAAKYDTMSLDAIIGIESRGFYFGFAIALKLGLPFLPIRKKGKLPGETYSEKYDLEYGSAEIEIQKGILKPGDKVLIHDDVLATGGTASAAAKLVEKCGAKVEGFDFIMSIDFLNGEQKLKPACPNIYNLAHC